MNHPAGGENPFVGPRSIPERMALFGRDRETRDLYRVVVADRVVLLHSPSGAGKSSLVNAGLIPLLKRKRFRVWPIVRVNTEPPAGHDPETIDRYTLSALGMVGAGLEVPSSPIPTFLEFFAAQAPGGLDAVDQVLVFDQFEEVLTTDPDDPGGKSRFFEGLGRLLKYPGFHAVFSVRDEYVGPWNRTADSSRAGSRRDFASNCSARSGPRRRLSVRPSRPRPRSVRARRRSWSTTFGARRCVGVAGPSRTLAPLLRRCSSRSSASGCGNGTTAAARSGRTSCGARRATSTPR
jgi:hypothetical protein